MAALLAQLELFSLEWVRRNVMRVLLVLITLALAEHHAMTVRLALLWTVLVRLFVTNVLLAIILPQLELRLATLARRECLPAHTDPILAIPVNVGITLRLLGLLFAILVPQENFTLAQALSLATLALLARLQLLQEHVNVWHVVRELIIRLVALLTVTHALRAHSSQVLARPSATRAHLVLSWIPPVL